MTWIKSCNIFDWFILACSSMFRIPFIFRAEQYSAIVLLYFVDSFFHESLSFFHSLVLDNPGLDLSIGISLQDSAFKCFGSPPGSGIAGSSIILRLVPRGIAILFSLVVELFHIVTRRVSVHGFQFFCILTKNEVIFHCGFNSNLPNGPVTLKHNF